MVHVGAGAIIWVQHLRVYLHVRSVRTVRFPLQLSSMNYFAWLFCWMGVLMHHVRPTQVRTWNRPNNKAWCKFWLVGTLNEFLFGYSESLPLVHRILHSCSKQVKYINGLHGYTSLTENHCVLCFQFSCWDLFGISLRDSLECSISRACDWLAVDDVIVRRVPIGYRRRACFSEFLTNSNGCIKNF